ALARGRWPGNVRQLQNVVFRAVTLGETAQLDLPELELAGFREAAAAAAETPSRWDEAIAECERALLARWYPRYPSSRKLAAQLGVSHTLIARKLKQYGIG
ncbi:MAG TPA: TyrR/PhhR family helix-turn-helix DNA-binding protein, partial [Candidatus Competibacteraceae bacterium]|nr:TyrR/PhhR family helix-turn-helix DNA-binding protein [Candidatus Competibacteraceae bacterium]